MSKKIAEERLLRVGDREFELVCPICGGKKFYDRLTLMNTAGATYFGFDWANKEATNFICEDCSYIFWFMDDPSVPIAKEQPLTKKEEFEIEFEKYSDRKLRKIIEGKDYMEDAKAAAEALLAKRNSTL